MPSLDDTLCFAKDLVLFLALKQQKVCTPLLAFGKVSREGKWILLDSLQKTRRGYHWETAHQAVQGLSVSSENISCELVIYSLTTMLNRWTRLTVLQEINYWQMRKEASLEWPFSQGVEISKPQSSFFSIVIISPQIPSMRRVGWFKFIHPQTSHSSVSSKFYS